MAISCAGKSYTTIKNCLFSKAFTHFDRAVFGKLSAVENTTKLDSLSEIFFLQRKYPANHSFLRHMMATQLHKTIVFQLF